MSAMLHLSNVSAGYGSFQALFGVSLDVHPGEAVAVIGPNGAGKTTLLRVISKLIEATDGALVMEGQPYNELPAHSVISLGIAQVPEGRRLFRTQSVMANLELGLYGSRLGRAEEKRRLDEVLATFPMLAERPNIAAGARSGGQQQMLAIAQALLRTPKLLMLDEPSLGLAPIIVDQVMDVILKLRAQGVAIVLVEQLVERALEVADVAYVLQNGRVIGSGRPDELQDSELIKHAYLGV